MNMIQSVWVFAEHKDDELEECAWKLIIEGRGLAGKLACELSVIIIGSDPGRFTGGLASCGAEKIFAIGYSPPGKYPAEVYISILEELVRENRPSVILFGATPLGKDLAPRLAARLKTVLISNYTELGLAEDGRITARKQIFAGKAQAVVASSKLPLIATIDPQLIGSRKTGTEKNSQVISSSVDIDQGSLRARVIDYIKADPRTVDISESEIVIGVGKGLDSGNNLRTIEELAEVLGAAIGGSRRAVDEGWIPHERQIGLTGKSISPKLYLACGISGSSYHTMGIREARSVVSINTDRNAPISHVAGLAVVGDMNQIIPALTRRLREITGSTDKVDL